MQLSAFHFPHNNLESVIIFFMSFYNYLILLTMLYFFPLSFYLMQFFFILWVSSVDHPLFSILAYFITMMKSWGQRVDSWWNQLCYKFLYCSTYYLYYWLIKYFIMISSTIQLNLSINFVLPSFIVLIYLLKDIVWLKLVNFHLNIQDGILFFIFSHLFFTNNSNIKPSCFYIFIQSSWYSYNFRIILNIFLLFQILYR